MFFGAVIVNGLIVQSLRTTSQQAAEEVIVNPVKSFVEEEEAVIVAFDFLSERERRIRRRSPTLPPLYLHSMVAILKTMTVRVKPKDF